MLILFTADHGEELFEHGGWWHGTTLYDEQIHVPFIAKPPARGARGQVVSELVTTLDAMPTILKAVGVAGPAVMQGHAVPLDGGAAPGRDSVFAEEDFEGNVLQAVRTKATKLVIANPGNPRGLAPESLYDLATDPGETRNVASSEAVTLEEMRAALGRSFVEARAHAGGVATTEMDAATRDRLKMLGYLE
jgi:arylsulfatase A-like enzyme